MLLIIVLLLVVFILNFIAYWAFYFKNQNYRHKSPKIFSCIMIITIGFIPIINSSFLQFFFKENISYFGQYWLWFSIIGLIFIVIGIKIHSLAVVTLNVKKTNTKQRDLIKKGVFEITRHPVYLSWILIFFGIVLILDSFAALILCPILTIFMELLGFFEEKYILIPEFGKKYEDYRIKTPKRLISPPYNYLLIIIATIVVYIGFLNFSNIA